jgi:hypothetical protein
MEARKHPRLSELIRAGMLVARGRAHTYAMGSPSLVSGSGVSEGGYWPAGAEGAMVTTTATVNGGASGSARVGLGFNWG